MSLIGWAPSMRRFGRICCGLLLMVAGSILLWNAPLWYTNQEYPIPPAYTQATGIALIILGALAAFWSAVCLGRAMIPLRIAPDGTITGGGGPVLPLCGMILAFSGIGPLRYSDYGTREYAIAEAHPGQFQDWAVELSHRWIGLGRNFAVLEFVLGGLLLAAPLITTPRIWQLRRRLNVRGRKIAIAGFLIAVLGILLWFASALIGAIGALAHGAPASHEPSYVAFAVIIAGTGVALVGTLIALVGKSETPSMCA
jgi:hypothetical protein